MFLGAPLVEDEAARQDAVERSGVLRRTDRSELQSLVDRAAEKFGMAIAAVSVLDRGRQWLAARIGLDVEETSRHLSFCAHAIHRPGELLVVPDARKDTRFAENPLVTGSPWIRFYAGKPLVTRHGYPIGTLCIVDPRPQTRSIDLFELTALAWQAERVINGWS